MARGRSAALTATVAALLLAAVLVAAIAVPASAISHDNFETFEKIMTLLREEGVVNENIARRALERHFGHAAESSDFYGASASDAPVMLYGYSPIKSHSDKLGGDKSSAFYGFDNLNSFLDSAHILKSHQDESSDDKVATDSVADRHETTSFYGFYGTTSSAGFYGSSIVDSGYKSLLDRYPDLEDVSDPRLRAVLKRHRHGSSFDDQHRGDADKESEFYGHTVSFYGYAPAPSRGDNSASSSSSRGGDGHSSPTQPESLLSVSFTVAITGDYATPESKALLASDINRSLQGATSRLGISRFMSGVTITPVTDVSPTTVSMNVEIVFNRNTNGIYQFAQMLRENAIYVFPLSEYAGAQVSSVRVAPYSPGAPTVPTGPYAGQIGQGDQGDRQTKGSREEEAPAGCALDRFSLNGEPSCCYQPFRLDAKYECCKESAGVDECGVCGGGGQTCGLRFAARISVPASVELSDVTSSAYNAVIQKYQQGIALLFSEYGLSANDVEVITEAVSVQSVPAHRNLLELGKSPDAHTGRGLVSIEVQTMDITAVVEPRPGLELPPLSAVSRLLQQAAGQKARYEDLQFLAVLEVRREGVCFNGICEVGEMADPLNPITGPGTCPQDCPVTRLCPMPVRPAVGVPMTPCAGRGVCDEAAGTCACELGYAGEACSQCEDGFILAAGAKCEPICPHTPDVSLLVAGDPLAPCGNRGTCDLAAGKCSCMEGYMGPECGRCAEGYFASNGICLRGVGTAATGYMPPADGTSNAVIISVSIVIAALVGSALVWFLVARARWSRSEQPSAEERSPFTDLNGVVCTDRNDDIPPAVNARAQTTDCHADPEPPTRQAPDGRRVTYPLASQDLTSV